MTSTPIKRMVVGFMFDAMFKRVVLIIKNKPDWQAGRHNGVGGKIEPEDDSSRTAMVREFHEETGLATEPVDWKPFGKIWGDDWEVYMFAYRWMDGIPPVQSTTDERIVVVELQHLHLIDDLLLNDVAWMIQAARFSRYPGGPKWLDVRFGNITKDSFEDHARRQSIPFPSSAWDHARSVWDLANPTASAGGVVGTGEA